MQREISVQEIIESQAPFVEIRFIGEFEAPEWEMLPPDWRSRDAHSVR